MKENTHLSNSLFSVLFAADVFKPTQGRVVRQLTCGVIWVVAVLVAFRISRFAGHSQSAALAVSVGLLGIWLGFRAVNYSVFAEFLIGVEAEMAKVTWPRWQELYLSSAVVVSLMLFLAVVIFLFDLSWRVVFDALL